MNLIGNAFLFFVVRSVTVGISQPLPFTFPYERKMQRQYIDAATDLFITRDGSSKTSNDNGWKFYWASTFILSVSYAFAAGLFFVSLVFIPHGFLSFAAKGSRVLTGDQ